MTTNGHKWTTKNGIVANRDSNRHYVNMAYTTLWWGEFKIVFLIAARVMRVSRVLLNKNRSSVVRTLNQIRPRCCGKGVHCVDIHRHIETYIIISFKIILATSIHKVMPVCNFINTFIHIILFWYSFNHFLTLSISHYYRLLISLIRIHLRNF